MKEDYNFREVEKKWQEKWGTAKIFESDRDDNVEKYFINFPFPYINGAPHLGHGYSLMKAEIMARFQRMLGKNVLFPFAFHATGEPIVGMAKRVKERDPKQLDTLRIMDVPEKLFKKFEDPYFIVEYFKNKWIETVQAMGLSIDWRRKFVTTTLTPVFSKFIEWQYRKLREDGYVIQGSHPVIWCPNCRNPTGDHDRLKGEGARVVDFVLIKFYSEKFDAYFLPATLRPETTFGVTNMFIHPEAKYVKVKIDGSNYVVAEKTVIKFIDQEHEVEVIEEINVKDIMGTELINPITKNKIPVLPGKFIDFEGSTGVVMSVPAHAPMDWIALKNLQDDEIELIKWNISPKKIKEIKPISLIKVDGYGEFPAGEAIDSMNIKTMDDPNVKEATKLIYRKEYNHGILKNTCGKYEGKKVSEVKDEIVKDFIDQNISFILKEPAEPVVCRCGTRNHVKHLQNQWFLKFSDEDWKKKAHQLVDDMNVFPEDARAAFHATIDWLENKACARRSGLGTPLPWDKEWIVETLSDSVIYMAYYILSKYVNSGEFKLEWATDPVFNYIFLGKGKVQQLSESTGAPVELLKEIHKDMDYYYGFDLRTSGKDLVTNHLTFMLMHHTAIFPKKYWPKGIAVNGYVSIIKPGTLKAEKMSKSLGNFRTIEDVINAFGVDATRLGFAIAGEGMKDAQFSLEEGENYRKWIDLLYEQAFENADDNEIKNIDLWLYSQVQGQIKKTRKHLSVMETRSAFQAAYHDIQNSIKWYLKRRNSKGPAYVYAIEQMIRMVTPFIPHTVEEIWKKWGRDGFASQAQFPIVDETKINKRAENNEKVLADFMDDLRGLITFLTERGTPKPKEVEIFVSPEWKFKIYKEAYENGLNNLIKRVMADSEMRKKGKAVANYCQSLIKAGGPPDFPWEYMQEWDMLSESKDYIESVIDCPIKISKAEGSQHPKAKAAQPRRPGINLIIEN